MIDILNRTRAEIAAERHDRLTAAAKAAKPGHKLRLQWLNRSACLERMAAERAVRNDQG